MKRLPVADGGEPPTHLIDEKIVDLADWRGALLARLRAKPTSRR